MISVVPETFTLVEYDPAAAAACVATALGRIADLPTDLDIEWRIDEREATSRLWIESVDPVVLCVDSGAVEDYKEPRMLGEHETEVAASRLLLELVDRRSAAFGAPELGAEVSLRHKMAWDVNLYGRVARLGLRLHQPRFRYNFRNRHGFTDRADQVFDELWARDALDWAEIVSLSDSASAGAAAG